MIPLRISAHAAVVAALVVFSLQLGSFEIHIANLALIYVMIAVGLSLSLGYAGQVNLAQAACFGIGSYTIAVLTLKTSIGFWGAFPLAVLAGALLGFIVAIPSLRVQSHYLGIVTLGLAISFTAILTNSALTGQAIGLPGIPGPTLPGIDLNDEHSYFYVLLAAVVILFALALLLTSTALGRRFKALRDDHLAAAHSGVEVPIYRMLAFTIGGGYAGVAGAFYAGLAHYVSPDTYSLAIMFLILAMVIMGGRDSIYGAVLGAALLIYARQEFQGLQQYQQIGYGTMIVLCVVFAPSGLAGLIANTWRWLAARTLSLRSPRDIVVGEDDTAGLGVQVGAPLAAHDGEKAAEHGTVLEIRGVTKRFRGLTALNDVTLDIAGGAIHGIVGPNGSGKTTLFNVITGVYGPTSGSVRLHGRRISGRRAYTVAHRGVARTFQGVRLFRSLTVRENVMVALDDSRPTSVIAYILAPWLVLLRERRLRDAADKLLRDYRLAPVADFLGTNLPYGQQRLVEVARAMASRPSILLLDEPAAGLNSTEMDQLAALIRSIRNAGTTIVLIEHNMGLVMNVCDRITVLANGSILADADPVAISRDPRVIEAYLGTGSASAVEGSAA